MLDRFLLKREGPQRAIVGCRIDGGDLDGEDSSIEPHVGAILSIRSFS
jgi:hypothetical protein